MAWEYKEEQLIKQFKPWFIRSRNYDEKFEDTDTSRSAPVDSVGFIGDQAVLIEYKHSLGPKEVFYENSIGSSIEKKIRNTLHELYHVQKGDIYWALASWDQIIEPKFILVSNSYSVTVLQMLEELLRDLRVKWHFGYEVIGWDGKEGDTLLYSPPKQFVIDPKTIIFPEMPSTAMPRGKRMCIQQCKEILEGKELNEIFDFMVTSIRELGGREKGNAQANINYSFPPSVTQSVIGIWPRESDSKNGMLVTFWVEGLYNIFGCELDIEKLLPGVPGPRRGHLGASRYIRTIDEAKEFWEFLQI